jgi:hypothetical protein
MPEKAAFFHFYSAFCFIPREISGLGPSSAHGEERFFTTLADASPSEAEEKIGLLGSE